MMPVFRHLFTLGLTLLATTLNHVVVEAQMDGASVINLQVCTVTDKAAYLESYAVLSEFLKGTPGIEALSVMDAGENTVALVEAWREAGDFMAAVTVGMENNLLQPLVGSYIECNSEIWGGWTNETVMLMSQLPGTAVFHENQEGFIDFCRDGGAPSSRNFPNMFFFQGRRTTDVALNQETLKAMGDFYKENVPGVLAWVTAVNPSQPDVVHDFQLFRDIYAFLDHTNPLVYPGLVTEAFPGLTGSWTSPLDYNGTYVGYDLTSPLAEEEYTRNGFPDIRRLDFHPLGTMDGGNDGFMKFCEREASEAVICEETASSVGSGGSDATSVDLPESAAYSMGFVAISVITLLFAALSN